MRARVALIALLVAAAIEAWLLHVMVYNPPGGWGSELGEVYKNALELGSLPLIIAGVACLAYLGGNALVRELRPVRIVAAAGPASIALAQLMYGHAMMLPLAAGFVVQVVAAIACFAR